MFCSQCGSEVAADGQFCTSCGAPTQPPASQLAAPPPLDAPWGGSQAEPTTQPLLTPPPVPPGAMETGDKKRKKGRWLIAAAVLVVGAGIASYFLISGGGGGSGSATDALQTGSNAMQTCQQRGLSSSQCGCFIKYLINLDEGNTQFQQAIGGLIGNSGTGFTPTEQQLVAQLSVNKGALEITLGTSGCVGGNSGSTGNTGNTGNSGNSGNS